MTELLPLVLPIFLHPDPRISLDMSSYMGTEDGGGSTVTVCAVLGNVVAMIMGGPEVTTSDIMTTFNLAEGTNASKNAFPVISYIVTILSPLPLKLKRVCQSPWGYKFLKEQIFSVGFACHMHVPENLGGSVQVLFDG